MLALMTADAHEGDRFDELVDSYYNTTFLMEDLLRGYSHALPPRLKSSAPVEVKVQVYAQHWNVRNTFSNQAIVIS